ncbi:MAG: PD-(D/E)XK nuclease domain-containing protein [Deltaproteobacteria bacterium]|nr:PD-(D/E)XK nuclease domain-containing protein [Deltaproteobacteria bacterium]
MSYQAACLEYIFGEEVVSTFPKRYKALYAAILTKDAQSFTEVIEGVLGNISYFQHIPLEKYYHSVVQSALVGMGFETLDKVPGSNGRSDMAIILPDDIQVILELKHRDRVEPRNLKKIQAELASGLKEARLAIENKKYDHPFFKDPSKIVKIGLAIYGRSDARTKFFN